MVESPDTVLKLSCVVGSSGVMVSLCPCSPLWPNIPGPSLLLPSSPVDKGWVMPEDTQGKSLELESKAPENVSSGIEGPTDDWLVSRVGDG